MTKLIDDSILNAAFEELKSKANKMTVCSAAPANYAAADNGGSVFLGDVIMASTDFTIVNGDVSGRKCKVQAMSNVNVDVSGDATHVCLLDTVNSKILYMTQCTAPTLSVGSSLTFPTWDVEIGDPS